MRFRQTLKICTLCSFWFCCSSMNNVIGKQVLTHFEYPMTLTFVQLLSITVYSIPLLHTVVAKSTNNNHTSNKQFSSNIYWKIIVPLAIGKFVASVSSHVSIWQVSVSYAHTVKATMPLFTVAIQRVIFNESQPTAIYLSLIPIITGVFIATLTELSFNATGLITALMATCGFSLQNIFSKQVLKTTNTHQFTLLHQLARLSLLFFIPIWVLVDLRSLLTHDLSHVDTSSILTLLFLDGLLNFLQNILAFTVLNLVTPLTYAVANATKRIFIITLSILVLRNPVTLTNAFGILVALTGVFLYNRAKAMEKQKPYLPLHNNNSSKATDFV